VLSLVPVNLSALPLQLRYMDPYHSLEVSESTKRDSKTWCPSFVGCGIGCVVIFLSEHSHRFGQVEITTRGVSNPPHQRRGRW